MGARYLTRPRASRVPVDILHRVLAGLHALGEVAR